LAQEQKPFFGKVLHQDQSVESQMKEQPSPRKKKTYRKPENKTCPYCGSENIERIQVHHVGVIKTCKNCREQID
jgi:transcription elongation factor Elf1